MIAETINESDLLRELNLPNDIETVEYPQEFIDRLRHIAEITKMQIATGEDKSIETLSRKLGFNYDEL